jgi:hypothetical protein
MRRLFDDAKISEQEIADIMMNDIIKREIIDSEESKKAKKDIDKIYKKLERVKEKNSLASRDTDTPGQKKLKILRFNKMLLNQTAGQTNSRKTYHQLKQPRTSRGTSGGAACPRPSRRALPNGTLRGLKRKARSRGGHDRLRAARMGKTELDSSRRQCYL